MPSPKKIEIVKKLKETLEGAKSLVLTRYQGLSTSQLDNLKKEMEKSGAKLLVVKNTLLKVVLDDLKINLPDEVFQGPTAVILAFDEGLKSLKGLSAFAKTTEGRPEIKLSFIEGQLFNKDQSLVLSTLPGREVLVGKFLGLLSSPIQRLVVSLKSDQRKLIFVLNEISRKKV